MSALSAFASIISGEQFTLVPPDSSLICDCFIYDGFMYIRTPTKYLMKPVYKKLFKKITKQTFEYYLSAYRTNINRSQAKGLLKYTQLEFDYEQN